MTLRGAPATYSLFGQMLGLIAISLACSAGLGMVVVANLDLPAPDFYRLRTIAQVIRGGHDTDRGEHRPLVTRVSDRPPATRDTEDGVGMTAVKTELGQMIGVAPGEIVVTAEYGRFPDRKVFRLVHEQLTRDGLPAEEKFLLPPFKVAVHRTDGRWLVVEPQPSLAPNTTQLRTMLWLLLSTIALTPVAYLSARRLARPIAVFAAAAERLGRDPGAPPIAIRGPREIAVAARAFNDMQSRLARYVSDRTAMVGAIAHDLRTPLTRLRFRAEAAPPELRAKMAADIAEMEAMISGALAFVLDANRPRERTRLELSSLLESLADEMSDTGLDVAVDRADRVVLEGDPIALRRLFNNLLDNAVKFGGQARVGVFAELGFAVVEIEDDGAGLPPGELDRVFEPFYRRETSRSRETGGIGLGLAVVRSISRAHGGDAMLDNRPGGGLMATVKLPI